MKKRQKLLIAILALLCLGLLTLGALAAEEPALDGAEVVKSGSCGDSVEYTLYDDGLLVISGTGAMKDYSYSSITPWYYVNDNDLRVEIQSGVTSIGSYAFNLCRNLSSVTIPDSVTSIGESAFQSCNSLTSVNIPSSVTSIGEGAFKYCDGLTSVNIPSGVTSIENSTFYGCESLAGVNIPSGVTSIGASAFNDCDALTGINIPSSVTSIGYQAFYDSDGLTSVTIPSGVTSLGERAFYNCDSLTSVNIPSSVTEIGKEMFCSCDELTNVNIANGVTAIGERAFVDCKKLANITIPSSVTSIGPSAFSNCDSLTGAKIPSGVTVIESGTFYGCYALTSVTIPEGVTSIGNQAFYWCNNLKSITIPSSVTRIASSAFYNCDSLTDVTIPQGITSIETDTFYGCDNLAAVTIPVSVTSIGRDAFVKCSALKDIYYAGTEEQWAAVSIAESNIEVLAKVTVHGAGGSSFAAVVVPVDRIEPTVELQDVSTDPGSYVFREGHGSSNLTSQWKYAGGQAYAMESYFTLATGENSGDHTIYVTFNSGVAKDYVFDAEAYAVYFLTYTYGVSSSSYSSGSSTVTVSGPGGETSLRVSASGGTLKSGGLKIVLVARGEPTPTQPPEPTAPPAKISIENASVTVKDQTYTGSKLKPAPTVKLDGKKLKKGTDYTVAYANNKTAGVATVTVTGIGDYTGEAKGTFKITCDAPMLKSAKVVASGVKVTWDASDGAVKYAVYRKAAGGSWEKLGVTTKTAYTDKTAQAGVKYAYRVRVVAKNGKTPVSAYAKSKTVNILATPAMQSAKNVKSGIKITWTGPDGAVKYAVYRKAAGGSWEKLGLTTKTAYTDKTAESGIKYAYRVCCVTKTGKSMTSFYSGTKAVTKK